jgi:hypothetical protein
MLVPSSSLIPGEQNPTGEGKKQLFLIRFQRVAFHGSFVTSKGGPLPVRELLSAESPAAAGEGGRLGAGVAIWEDNPALKDSTKGKGVYTRNGREAGKLLPVGTSDEFMTDFDNGRNRVRSRAPRDSARRWVSDRNPEATRE